MPKHLLSPKEIEHPKSKFKNNKEFLLNDGEGLFLRVRPNKSRNWFFHYTFNSKRKKLAIHGSNIKIIREQADEYRKQLSDKIDPKQKLIDDIAAKIKEEKLKLEASNNRYTVHKLFEHWLRLDLIHRKDGGIEVKRMFEKDVLPLIGNMDVESVSKANIIAIIDSLLLRGVNRMAKLILSLMRQMFRFAQDRDLITNDPTSSIRKAKIGGKDSIRDRHLSKSEIKTLHKNLPTAKLLKTTECAIWIMLSTCCRIGELSKAKWQDINLNDGVWVIPVENSKNGKAHTIYLSEFSQTYFKKLTTLKSSTTWLYPNRSNTDHISVKSITKQVYDRQLIEGKVPFKNRTAFSNALKLDGGKWTPHDLRRTGATLMGDLGIRPDVIEKCLNHVEQNKMIRTYQHQALLNEQKSAWQLLGDSLNLLVNN